MGTGKGQIIPVNAVAGPIQLGDQIVVEELGQVVSLGMVPESPNTSGIQGIAIIGQGVVVNTQGQGGLIPVNLVSPFIGPLALSSVRVIITVAPRDSRASWQQQRHIKIHRFFRRAIGASSP